LSRKDISSTGKLLLGLIIGCNSQGLHISNEDIAELLGVKPDTVTTILRELKNKGLIQIENPQSRYRKIFYSGKNSEVEPQENNSTPENNRATPENNRATPENNRATPENNRVYSGKNSGHKRINKKNSKKDNSFSELKDFFESARKLYPGTKRGLDTELKDFQKHPDWKEVLPLLEPSIRKEKAHKDHLTATGQFCPAWKHFKTWLSQRCWETEHPDPLQCVTREADETEIDELLGDVA